MIADFSCNNDKWTTCNGDLNPGVGSCSWIKGESTYLKNKNIYITTNILRLRLISVLLRYVWLVNYIVSLVRAGMDAELKWDHFRDGSYCDPEGGRQELSNNISSGSQCMLLGDDNSKRYVSFMMKPNNGDGYRYCYGYDLCTKQKDNTNYKTYVRRSDTGTL